MSKLIRYSEENENVYYKIKHLKHLLEIFIFEVNISKIS